MGQTNSTFTIANAFPQDVELKVNFLNPLETTPDQESTSQATLLKGAICTFEIPKAKEEDVVFVSLTFKDNEETHVLAKWFNEKNIENNVSWILTRDGKPIESSANEPWIGMEDKKNYQDDTCPTCVELEQICEICFVQLKMSNVGNSLCEIKKYIPEKSLMQFLAEVRTRQVFASNQQVQNMIDEIMEVALEYSGLEVQTRVIVGTIQVYGERWKEAAEDFIEDGIWEDFLDEIFTIKEMIPELRSAAEENNLIKSKVEYIKEKAETEANEFKNKKDIVDENIKKIENFGMKMRHIKEFSQASALFNPLSPYFIAFSNALWYCAKTYQANKTGELIAFQELENEAKNIFTQMGRVEEHLGVIVICLTAIDKKLQSSAAANEKFKKVEDQARKKKMACRASSKAEDLIQACLTYLNMTGKKTFIPPIQN